MYNNPNDRSFSRLLPTAYPTLVNAPNQPRSSTPLRKPPSKRVRAASPVMFNEQEELLNSSSSTIAMVVPQRHECIWRKRYTTTRKRLMMVQGKLSRLQRKNQQAQTSTTTIDPETSSGNFGPVLSNFIRSQEKFFSRLKGGMRWSKEDIKFAISIYYKSPSTYHFLRTIFGLPAPTVIYKELRMTMAFAGICGRTLEGIKCKTEAMEVTHRCCSLVVDGMKIDQGLQYLNSDVIAGFEELGNEDRTKRIASEMVVIMIQGIGAHWKQVTFHMLFFPLKTEIFFSKNTYRFKSRT